VSTLWLSNVLGSDRLTVGLMLAVTWLLPLVLRWARTTTAGRSTEPVRVPLPRSNQLESVPVTVSVPRRRSRRTRRR
jgi:hypothetical protein